MKILAIGLVAIAMVITIALGIAATQLPAIGAGALLFPSRHVTTRATPAGCEDRTFNGVDLTLRGWRCKTTASPRRGTIVYLHGVADNRGSAIGVIKAFRPFGFDVIAYDGRAHGDSEGDRCTYGYYEKRDLQRVLDELELSEVILIGHSLGAAIALQAAAIEPRVRAVVAVSTFADLRTIATEHAFYYPTWSLGPAFAQAERDGHFVVDEVSPLTAAARIDAPVLLIHGALDRDTLPIHSQRVFAALHAPRRLIIVEGASHNDVLHAGVLAQIADWLNPLFEN
jgi:pimeloyl-ACP methyl ester carboxylesterase